MTDSTPSIAVRVNRFNSWRLRRRLRRAWHLYNKRKIGALDYAVIAVGVVTDLGAIPLTGNSFGPDFVILAGVLLGEDVADPSFHQKLERYGPLSKVPSMLGKAFPVIDFEGDVYNVQSMTFKWGGNAARALRRAKERLRPWNRWVETADSWRAEQKEIAPNLHDDLWKAIVGLGGLIAGFFMGRWTA